MKRDGEHYLDEEVGINVRLMYWTFWAGVWGGGIALFALLVALLMGAFREPVRIEYKPVIECPPPPPPVCP